MFNSLTGVNKLGKYIVEVSDDPYFVFKSVCGSNTASAAAGPFITRCNGVNGVDGRYVRITLPGQNRQLRIAEVQMLTGKKLAAQPWGYDVAKLVEAKMSSTFVVPKSVNAMPTCTAASCIDGKKQTMVEGCRPGNSMCHSGTRTDDEKTNPWLQVDLGARFEVLGAMVFNRLVNQGARLGKYQITVSDDPYFYTSETVCFDGEAQGVTGPFLSACKQSIKGRYVRLVLPGSNRILNIEELEVLTQGASLPAVDVGYSKAKLLQAALSSTYSPHCVAANCIDGKADGAAGSAQCKAAGSTMCHTKKTSNPWLQVDLGERYWIDSVVIFNRLNGNADKLGYHEVWVSDDQYFSKDNSYECFMGTAANAPGPFVEPCKAGMVGRYVRLLLPGNDRMLQIMEMEVLAKSKKTLYNTRSALSRDSFVSNCKCDMSKHNAKSTTCIQHKRKNTVHITHKTAHFDETAYAWKHLPGQQFRCGIVNPDATTHKGECRCCECNHGKPLL